MKKLLTIVLCLALLFGMSGCGEKETVADGKLSVVTTVFPLYDFLKNVAGDKAEITLLLPTGADAHSYEPTVQDVIKIQNADAFVILGTGADVWTESIIGDKSFDKEKVLSAMEYTNLIEEHHEENHNVPEYDQHIWTSLKNSADIVEGMAEFFAEKDSLNAGYYRENASKYIEKLRVLDKKFEALLKDSNKTLVFADRFPFAYFIQDYNLKYEAAFPGCSSESEPSAATVAKLIDKIREEEISTLFYTETSNGQLPDAMCRETGAQKAMLHSCHTVTKEQLKAGVTFYELMENNYLSLEKFIAE